MDKTTTTVPRPRLAVALSGGGFRASLFHLGVLRRIAEAGWLPRLDVLSTVSGGSIIGAFAAVRWGALMADGATVDALDKHVIAPFFQLVRDRDFIGAWKRRLLTLPLRKLLDRSFTRTAVAADLFGSWFLDRQVCNQLPESPYVVINAANLISGRAWRFTRDGLGDSRLGYAIWDASPLPLGFAVGASAAFPPVFPPARVDATKYGFSGPVYGESPLPAQRLVPLTDGGVYDNLGVEALMKPTPLPGRILQPAEFLIASDAGYPAQQRFRASGLPAISEGLLLYRVDEVARDQVGALRRRMLVRDLQAQAIRGALVVLGSSIQKLPSPIREQYSEAVGASAMVPVALATRIQKIRTNLNSFSAGECEALSYHGYTLTDAVLWANEGLHPAEWRTSHPGQWRLSFTPEKIHQWETSFR